MMTIKQKNQTHTEETDRSLNRLGWNPYFQAHLNTIEKKDLFPARVIGVEKNSFFIDTGKGERRVSVSGRLSYHQSELYPVIGDWVLINQTVIITVLPRKNALTRGASGTQKGRETVSKKVQVIAANLDTVCIVCGLDRDFNIRRIERYLTLVYNCGLNPIIILTKADLHKDPESCVSELASVAFHVPVHLISLTDDACLSQLHPYLSTGRTLALIGSSGAGKSTLVNRLCGEDIRATGAVSERIGKGMHVTTSRSLIMMPQGGMIIDNPGIREIVLWEDQAGVVSSFPDIESLGKACRFSDCSHMHEPGCQVLEAVNSGRIEPKRLNNYYKLRRELEYLSQRQNKSAGRIEKERWQEVALKVKAMKRSGRK